MERIDWLRADADALGFDKVAYFLAITSLEAHLQMKQVEAAERRSSAETTDGG